MYLSLKLYMFIVKNVGFPDGSVVKNLPVNAEDTSLIPGLGRSPGKGNGNPLWYSCLENPTNRGASWVTVHEVAKELDTTEVTKHFTCTHAHALFEFWGVFWPHCLACETLAP